jgi:hypothetical protein
VSLRIRQDSRIREHLLITSPFSGEKGRLHELGLWRGRREPQDKAGFKD